MDGALAVRVAPSRHLGLAVPDDAKPRASPREASRPASSHALTPQSEGLILVPSPGLGLGNSQFSILNSQFFRWIWPRDGVILNFEL